MRWVLRLPLFAGQPGRVEFLIEQRGDYQGASAWWRWKKF